MVGLYALIEFGATFIEFYIAYLVMAIVFREKRIDSTLPYVEIILTVIATFVVFCFNQESLFSYLTIVIAGSYLSVSARIFYRVNYLTIFSVVSFYLLCLNSFDFFMLTLISDIYWGPKTLIQIISSSGLFRSVVISVIKILWILIYFGIKNILRKMFVNMRGAYVILVTSGVGFMGFVFLVNQAMKAFNYTMSAIWFVVICCLASVIFGGYFIIMRQEERLQMNVLEMRNTLLSENYKELSEIYRNNSKLYHDLNNHLNVLYQLLNEENINEAKDYIKEISKPILGLSKTAWTGIDVVDVVINSKLQKMNETEIMSDINVEFPKACNILPNDVCTILSNLLDNAIEATQKVEESKYIKLIIRRAKYFLFIRVSNPCKKMKEFEVLPKTTKDNKNLHGWGLQSVNDVVEKYNGRMECLNIGTEFVVNIMLTFDVENNG